MNPARNTNAKQPASRQKAGKRPPTRTSWRPGTSGNPAGRKSSGQSWAEIFKAVTDKTADELAAEVGGSSNWLGATLESLPPGVQFKYLIAVRVLAALMGTLPSAGLLKAVISAEGLPAIPDQHTDLDKSDFESNNLDDPTDSPSDDEGFAGEPQ